MEESQQAPTPVPETRRRSQWLAVLLAPVVIAGLMLAVWVGAHWWDDTPDGWGQHARRAYRASRTLEVSPDDWRVNLSYANELMAVELLSPVGVRDYLAMRVDAHCERAVAQGPPGAADMCVYPELERLWRKRDGATLLTRAFEVMPQTANAYRDVVHRYAARGAQLQQQWDVCTEQFETAFGLSGMADDALAAGWSALNANDTERALRLLDAAEAANGGYPGDAYRRVRSFPMRPREREAAMASLRVRAAFFHAVRDAGQALARGEDVTVPAWPG